MLQNRVLFLTLVPFVMIAGFSGACRAETEVPRDPLSASPYTEATFTYSSDPHKLLLFVSSTGMSFYQRTVGLYGDGRLVFKRSRWNKVTEEQTVTVEPLEIQRLLRLAVDHGLAEWDLTRVHAKQLENNQGKLYTAIPSDSTRDVLLVSLDDYERGTYRVPRIERKIEFKGAAFADKLYPPILEIRGILELKKALYSHKPEDRP